MNKAIDNMILLVFSSVMVFGSTGVMKPVIALLVAVITVALELYFSEKLGTIVISSIFAMLCFILPELTFFLPVIAYQGYGYPGLALCVMPFFTSVHLYEFWEIWIWISLCFLSLIMAGRTKKLEDLDRDMIRMRDTSTELNLVLKEKNKNLMEKQDYEVYLATLRERNRIAREIHDNVGHMLSRCILQLGALGTVHQEEPLKGQLLSINETLNQAMNSVRESVHDLHDDSVDLRQAVKEVTKAMEENYNIHVDYDMTRKVPREVKYCFITTIKEAMSNIIKHSDGDSITILLREHPGFYQLSIEDNGSKKEVGTGEGIGLSNMKQRVESLDGTIRIRNENGFRIFISVKKQDK